MGNRILKTLKEYYTNYYNSNFLRDYRYIYKDKKKHKYNDILHENRYTYDDSRVKGLNFLTTIQHRGYDGDLFSTLSYYKDLKDYHKGDNDNKYSDRLFFDFDIGDERVDKIKDSMSNVYKSSDDTDKVKMELITRLKEDFRNLVLEEDLLYDVFIEASRLCDYLESVNLKPFLIFSGSKGFHINIFFKEMQLNQISKISHDLFNSYQKRLDLRYLDEAVNKDALGRSQRVQYAYHSNTDLLTQPIATDMSYDDMLSVIEKNKRKPIKFDIMEYLAPAGFTKYLQKRNTKYNIDSKFKRMNNIIKQQLREEKVSKFNVVLDYESSINIDMRELARYYGIDGKSNGEKIIIKCPFHDDHHPSAVVNSKGIYCSTCARSFNYYDLIAEMENTTDKSEIMKIARKHSR